MSGPLPIPTGESSPLVLIANDQEWTARAVESILVANGCRVLRAFTATETLEIANGALPDMVILDQQLPDFSGVEVCRRLRADPRFGATLPIFITTAGPSGRQQRLAAYDAGAWEFYGQPLDAEALLHKLRVYYAASQEVRQLRINAMIDGSTGLYNRLGLGRRATELLGEARRGGRALACVGWEMTDAVEASSAQQAGLQLRRHGRAADTFGRLDLRSFAAVAAGTGPAGAERLAERIRERLVEVTGGDDGLVRSRVVVIDEPDHLPSDGNELLDQLTHALAA